MTGFCQRNINILLLGMMVLGCPQPLTASESVSIVLGSFGSRGNADSKRAELEQKLVRSLRVTAVEVKGQTFHRLLTSPTSDVVLARRQMETFRSEQYPDAWLLFHEQAGSELEMSAAIRSGAGAEPDSQLEDIASKAGDEDGFITNEPEDTSTIGLDDELFSGFDDFEVTPSDTTQKEARWIDFGGQFMVASTYSYDLNTGDYPGLQPYNGVSKAQTILRMHTNLYFKEWRLHVGAKGLYDWFYDIEADDQFTNDVLDEHRSETEWHEVYLQGNITDSLYLKTGRQILSWGRSDSLRVLDQLNPLDLREPGSTDIEDIRLPVNMTRVSYVRGPWTMDMIAIHEIRFNKLPAPGSEFMPGVLPVLAEEIPDDGWAAEHAFNLTGVFPGWDVSFHHARLYDDNSYLDLFDPTGPMFKHQRLHFSGMAFNRTIGSWLLKGEYARIEDFQSNAAPARTRRDVMLGFEYSGFINTQLAVETSVQHLHDWHENLDSAPIYRPRDLWQSAFRISRTFLNERLTLLLVALFQGKSLDEGQLVRFNADYKPFDALTTSLGIIIYSGGSDSVIGQLEDRDRVLLGIKYHF